jgi:hypothetical protein
MDVKSMHIGFPRTYIALSRGFSSSHKGIDMCWNSNYGGANAPVYAPADGKVVATVNTMGNTAGKDNSWGNLVKIDHGNNVYTLMAHLLKGSVCVKVGDKVVRGQQVAKMNNSGNSYGCHVHFELYIGGSGTGYRVDPLKYVYAYPNDVVNKSTQAEYNIMHYSPIQYYGHPVERNSKVDQFKVDTDTLRARKEPSLKGEVLGYVNKGIYNVGESVRADGYIWYKIEDFWCAYDKAWAEFLPKTEPHYDLLMKKLNEAQARSMEVWCKAEGVEYTLTEV